jgi:hypothetical protein
VTGGRTSTTIKKKSFGKYVSFYSATTSAEGFLKSTKQAIAVSRGRLEREHASTTTTVRAEIIRLSVGDNPKLTVKRVVAALGGQSAPVGEETSVKVKSESSIEGVSIGGHDLVIKLSTTLFHRCDTCAKLLADVESPTPESASCSRAFRRGASRP